MNKLLQFIVLCLGLNLYGQNPVLDLGYNESSGITTTKNRGSLQGDFSISNNFNRPERVSGISGNALRLDGFSTWVQGDLNQTFSDKLTIQTWISLESYPADLDPSAPSALKASSIISKTFNNTGFKLAIDNFGTWWFEVYVNGIRREIMAPSKFLLYEWVQVTAVAEINQGNLNLKLYQNGTEINSIVFPSITGTISNATTTPLVIGKPNSQGENFEGIFLINAINAAIDETKMYNDVITSTQILNDYNTNKPSQQTAGYNAIKVPDTRFASDVSRPRFHVMPPANWGNEPHGFSRDGNGEYHLYYQRSPNGPFKQKITWGHITSTDLANWTHQKDVLRPELITINNVTNFDTKGIWSGDVHYKTGDGNTAYAFYTCVNHGGNNYDPGIALAKSTDKGYTFVKQGPIISKHSSVSDMRDPYIWTDETDTSKYHMIIGAKLGSKGGLAHYTTQDADMKNWSYESNWDFNPLTDYSLWEMPVFEKLDNGKYLLIANPVHAGSDTDPKTWHGKGVDNFAVRPIYWIGTFTNNNFTPESTTHKNVDLFPGLISPSVVRDGNNNLIGIGIVDERRNSESQLSAGWTQTYSAPRRYSSITHNNVTYLTQKADPALASLRDLNTHTIDSNKSVTQTTAIAAHGQAIEIIATIDPLNTGNEYGITFFKSPDGSESTKLFYKVNEQKFYLDKTNSSLNGGVEEKEVLSADYNEAVYGKPQKFHILLDHSIIDVFINDKVAFSNRVYPTSTASNGIELYSNSGTTTFTSVETWNLGPNGIVQDVKNVEDSEIAYLKLDFESGDLTGWDTSKSTGSEFIVSDVTNQTIQDGVTFDQQGQYHLWGYKDGGDANTGTLQTYPFVLGGDGKIKYKISGGNNTSNLKFQLIVIKEGGDEIVSLPIGSNSEKYQDKEFEAINYVGKTCVLRLVDESTGGWGHLNLDDLTIPIQPIFKKYDFESGNLSQWEILSGTAFTNDGVTKQYSQNGTAFKHQGNYHYWGFASGGDTRTGAMKTKSFILGGNGIIKFKIAGGSDINNLYISYHLKSNDTELGRLTANNSESYIEAQFDAFTHIGEEIYIKVTDNSTGGWGHINIDDIRIPVQEPIYKNLDFESQNLSGWNVIDGSAFNLSSVSNASTFWGGSYYKQKDYHFLGGLSGDNKKGKMRTDTFTLGGDGIIRFKIGGGENLSNLFVALKEVGNTDYFMKVTGDNNDSEAYKEKFIDASELIGKLCYLEVVDNNTNSSWAHINIDDVRIPIELSATPPAGNNFCNYNIIDSNDFETEWGIWNDGGSDCWSNSIDDQYANGTYCVRLRDDSASSIMTTDTLDLSAYKELKVDFSYYPSSMDNANEDFWLQLSTDGGVTFTTIEEWNLNDEFLNDERYKEQVIIMGNFTSNTVLRFKCDASDDDDFIYIDDVVISGCETNTAKKSMAKAKNEEEGLSNETNKKISYIDIFPNPANEFVKVNVLRSDMGIKEIRIFDLNGGEIANYKGNNATNFSINTRDLNTGLYVVKIITNDDKVEIKKLLINR
jgi:sucrose-6-phosphate hydrolase SacC (GH32 family)